MNEIRVISCEAATHNTDGTYDIKRGGLDRFVVELPYAVNLTLFIHSDLGPLPLGRTFEMNISFSGVLSGGYVALVVLPIEARVFQVIFPMKLEVGAYGTLDIEIKVAQATGNVRIFFAP